MPSFQPFSSGGQSSHLQTPETTPLRKRENDSFASPEAPLLWRQPLQPATGALHTHNNSYSPSLTASSSHFAELGFPHMTRRRGRHDNRHGAQFWIPWLMKGILASPLIVLLIWFVVVTLHHPTESSTMKNNRYGITAKNTRNLQQQVQRSPRRQHPGKDKIPVYVPMGLSDQQQQQQQQYLSPGMPMLNNGIQGMQNPQVMLSQPTALENFPMGAGQSEDQVGFMQQQPPQLMMAQQGQVMQQPAQMIQQQPQVLQAQPQIILPGQNMMQLTTQQQPAQLFQQQQPLLQQPFMMQPQVQQPMMQGQPQIMNQNQMQMSVVLQQQQQPMEEAESQPSLMIARGNQKQNQRPAHPGRWGNLRGGRKSLPKASKQAATTEQLPKVYYYDPAHAVVQGQLHAPTIVYDEHGNEVELASLVSEFTDLYIEPPLTQSEMNFPIYGASQTNYANRRQITSSNSTATSNSTQSVLPFPPPPPPLEMKIKRPESWGESTTQDQSIIVCTVATMALLVGALSARRLRSRSFLSSCIENESLEDEVAYDNAYTVAGGDSYNTFGWKGDLEKFDV